MLFILLVFVLCVSIVSASPTKQLEAALASARKAINAHGEQQLSLLHTSITRLDNAITKFHRESSSPLWDIMWINALFHEAQCHFLLSNLIAEPRGELLKAEALFVEIMERDARGAPVVLDMLGRIRIGLHRDCEALKTFDELSVLKPFNKFSFEAMMLYASCASRCNATRGLQVWKQAAEEIPISQPASCVSCWYEMGVAKRRAGQAQEAERDFSDWLSVSTPWLHSTQLPRHFDISLASSEPQMWLDPLSLPVCGVLLAHKEVIQAEFAAYLTAVAIGEQVDLFDSTHDDSSLVSGGGWSYLYLSKRGAWLEDRCAQYFTQTCTALRKLPQVSGPLPRDCSNPKKYSAWCRQQQSFPGPVAFYRLAAGQSVPLHAGPSNQRLKCQFVLSGEKSWTEVGNERRTLSVNSVHAFDDSFLHSVGNEGQVDRVIFDVSFWHPKLSISHSEL